MQDSSSPSRCNGDLPEVENGTAGANDQIWQASPSEADTLRRTLAIPERSEVAWATMQGSLQGQRVTG
jgi:hypothetical protein